MKLDDFKKLPPRQTTSSPTRKPTATSTAAQDITEFLDNWKTEFAADCGEFAPYKDGRKAIFQICPFEPEHNNGQAAIFQNADGVISFHCLGERCKDKKWPDLRKLREPDYDD